MTDESDAGERDTAAGEGDSDSDAETTATTEATDTASVAPDADATAPATAEEAGAADTADVAADDPTATEDEVTTTRAATEPAATTEAEATTTAPEEATDIADDDAEAAATPAVRDDDAEATDTGPLDVAPVDAPSERMQAPLDATLTGSGRRFGAWVLDGLLAIVLLGIGWLIWSLVVWSKGQSPGKALLGMRVVRADTGRVATWGQMAARELVWKWLLGTVTGGITVIVSAIMILGESHQGIWDKLAGTLVVDDPEGRYLG